MKGANLGKSFYHRVGLQMSTMLTNMSVYDVLQRMLITDEFMLNLVPRFSTQDFKVELVPSYMWKTRESDNLDINATDLVAVSAVFNPIACLNIPQVLMVLFEDPIEYGKKLVGGGAATNYGVYSTDKQLNELMRSKRSTGTSTSENASEVDG